MRLRPVALLTAVFALANCTIESTRQLDDPCLMDRECAAGLRCQIAADGTARCLAQARFDVPLIPAADVTSDLAAAPDQAAPQDVAVDAQPARDASAPEASAVTDVTDVTDAGAGTDAGADAADAGS